MAAKKPVVINEARHYWIILVLSAVAIMLFSIFGYITLIGFIEDKDLWSALGLVVVLFGLCFYLWGSIRFLKSSQIVTVLEDRVLAESLWHKKQAEIDLTKNVFYTMYLIPNGVAFENYILISNNPFSPELNKQLKYDKSTQIKIVYTKQIKEIFPRSEWYEIVSDYSFYE